MSDVSDSALTKLVKHQLLTPEEIEHFIIDVPSRTGTAIFRGDAGFKRSQAFLKLLGDPQDNQATIHIAGTSGKGSTAAMLSRLLKAHGKSTLCYSSPHVYTLRERWQYNDALIDYQALARVVDAMYPEIEALTQTKWGAPTYFEITTAIAFLLARDLSVDYAVIETGMGGLYDTTNTITRTDKLAIITELGLDHTKILGNTLAKIAIQKAGILPPDGHAIVLQAIDSSATNVINETAQKRSTTLCVITPETYQNIRTTIRGTYFDYHGADYTFNDLQLSLIGEHQAKNASLALAALEYIARRDNFTVDETVVREVLQTTYLPGRFERRTINGINIVLDGAHNPQKLGGLVQTLKDLYPGQKFIWLVAFGQSKDSVRSLEVIAPLVKELIVTQFSANQDMPSSSQATDVNALVERAHRAGIESIVTEKDTQKALATALDYSPTSAPLIIAGSFYLLSALFPELTPTYYRN